MKSKTTSTLDAKPEAKPCTPSRNAEVELQDCDGGDKLVVKVREDGGVSAWCGSGFNSIMLSGPAFDKVVRLVAEGRGTLSLIPPRADS